MQLRSIPFPSSHLSGIPASTWWSHIWSIFAIWLGSRLLLVIATLVGFITLTEAQTPGGGADVSGLLAPFWRWDAIHYYTLATAGYPTTLQNAPNGQLVEQAGLLAFFPCVPLLIRATSMLLGGTAAVPISAAPWPPLLAGIVIANVAVLAAFGLLYRLVLADTGNVTYARRTVLYTAIFPLAFFYAMPYTESLFLLLTLATFWASRRGQWKRAGLWAALASTTRLTGLLLIPVLLWEMLQAWRRGMLVWRHAVIGIVCAPLGLLSFMIYLWQHIGDPLAFVHVQRLWHRTTVTPWIALRNTVDAVLTPRTPLTDLYFRNLLNLAVMLLIIGVLIVAWRSLRASDALYCVLTLLLVTTSVIPGDVLQSVGRYCVVLFPVWIVLARWGERPLVHRVVVYSCVPLYIVLTALHTRGYFVG